VCGEADRCIILRGCAGTPERLRLGDQGLQCGAPGCKVLRFDGLRFCSTLTGQRVGSVERLCNLRHSSWLGA